VKPYSNIITLNIVNEVINSVLVPVDTPWSHIAQMTLLVYYYCFYYTAALFILCLFIFVCLVEAFSNIVVVAIRPHPPAVYARRSVLHEIS